MRQTTKCEKKSKDLKKTYIILQPRILYWSFPRVCTIFSWGSASLCPCGRSISVVLMKMPLTRPCRSHGRQRRKQKPRQVSLYSSLSRRQSHQLRHSLAGTAGVRTRGRRRDKSSSAGKGFASRYSRVASK